MPAEAFGEPLPAMPFFRFTHESTDARAVAARTFYREVLARGVLLHPRHMWFLSPSRTPTRTSHAPPLEVTKHRHGPDRAGALSAHLRHPVTAWQQGTATARS